MIDSIVDIYYRNPWSRKMYREQKVVACIHKITEGLFKFDPAAEERLLQLIADGLLGGGYHFSSGENGKAQAEFFLSHIPKEIDLATFLIELDWESSSGAHNPSNMGHDTACEFVQTIVSEVGRYPVVYGSNLPRESVSETRIDPVLTRCPLHIAQIGPRVSPLPPTWRQQGWKLWQFQDDSLMTSRSTGYTSARKAAGWDRNRYNGDEAQLRAEWPFIVHA